DVGVVRRRGIEIDADVAVVQRGYIRGQRGVRDRAIGGGDREIGVAGEGERPFADRRGRNETVGIISGDEVSGASAKHLVVLGRLVGFVGKTGEDAAVILG